MEYQKEVGCYEINYREQKELPMSLMVKNTKKYSTKKEIVEMFHNDFVDIGSNLAASIPESKRAFQTIFAAKVLVSVSSLLRTGNLKIHLPALKQAKV